MIQLTDNAAERIRAMQNELEDSSRLLRVMVEPGGCSGFEYGMAFDQPKPDDMRVESHGVTVLIDPASEPYLKDCTIKFDDGLQGKGFEIINPNANQTCGCGRSFS